LDVLDNLIRNRATEKSNDFIARFGNEKHSKPQINTGITFWSLWWPETFLF